MPSRSRRLHLRQPLNKGEQPYTGVGAILYAARLKSNQSLEAVAQQLHIRPTHLKAIEDGRFNDLPGSAYAIGFIRSYAEHLSFDGEDLTKKFKIETSTKVDGNELRFPIPNSRGRLPGGRILVISAILVVVVYGLWLYISQSSQIPVQLVGSVPEHLAVTEKEILNPKDATISGEINGSFFEEHSTTTQSAKDDRTAAKPESEQDEIADLTAQPKIQNASAIDLITPKASADLAQVLRSNVSNSRIIITAHTDSWVHISDGQDATLLSRVLHAGEKFHVPNQPNLLLMTGNAGAIQIVVDGQAIAPLGGVGAVRRGVRLDPKSLLELGSER